MVTDLGGLLFNMSTGVNIITATLPVWGQVTLSVLVGAGVAGAGALIFSRATNARRTSWTTHDQLTGVANERFFKEQLQTSWRAARDTQEELGLLVVDVDAVGDINERYGRTTGDRVLAEVAERIELRVRSQDFVARLRDNQFAVLCPRTSYEELVTLRRHLEAYVNRARSAPVMLSIGIGTAHDTDPDCHATVRRARRSMLERRDERPMRAVDEALAELLSR